MPDTAKLFWSGRSQAIRLPKEYAATKYESASRARRSYSNP